MSKRTFTIHDARKAGGCKTKFSIKGYTGLFKSSTPSAAASKAFTKLCRAKKIKGQCTLYITMRETTRGNNKQADGSKKLYHYMLKREKLDNPLQLAGRVVEYKNKCKSLKSMPSLPKMGCEQSTGRMVSN